jgi:hypothetical protein
MLKLAACLIATNLLMFGVTTNSQANNHVADCSKKAGVEALRCERHMKMAEKCGPLKGDAHFQCDREFLLANPLNCGPLKGEEAKACGAEVVSFKTCEPKAGRDFMICVKKETGQSPMGH